MAVDPTTVAVSGELDIHTAPDLAAALADPAVDQVVLTAVTFIDAAGLAVLVQGHRSRPQGVTLCSPSRHVVRLLELTGDCSTFRIVNT